MVYISVDIETDGPIPGDYSMLSLGAVAYSLDGRELGEFSVNLKPLEGAKQDRETLAWWDTQPEAWKAATEGAIDAPAAMRKFYHWVCQQGKSPIFVAYPVGFDFTFVYWYLMHFIGESPFSFSALDLKTMAATIMKVPYREAMKRKMPKEWFVGAPKHSHKAVDDARGQGVMLVNMLRALNGGA